MKQCLNSSQSGCTVKATCQNATKSELGRSPPRWVSLGSQQCIDFESVNPDTIPINEIRLLHLTIHELPQLPFGAKYLCVFGNTSPIEAQVSPNGLICATPDISQRPTIAKDEDHATVYLSVRSSETNTDFVSRSFHYFDCSIHSNCKTCTKSRWACSWCVYENTCTNNITSCQQTVISGENNPRQFANHGSSYCPRFRPGSKILLPHEIPTEIEVAVENLALPQLGQTGYQCILEIEEAKAVVPAKIKGTNFVVCGRRAYTYQAQTGEKTAKLTVVWNGNHLVDTTRVILYKCPILGSHRGHSDCSLCLTQDTKYKCAWCDNSCSYTVSCRRPPVNACPQPRIDLIRPLSAPIEGGTLVTIEGGNLGLSAEEVSNKVFIGDIPCELVEYNVSVRIVCRVGRSNKGEIEAAIRVGNKAGQTISSEKFQYKDIKVTKVSPNLGPQSGGTRLSIQGNHLNIGSNVAVYLDDLPCRVDSSLTTSAHLSCLTTRASTPDRVLNKLVVSVDGANRTLNYTFAFTRDPTISKISPTESFLSGGRHILVEGTDLTSIQLPRMAVYHKSKAVNETNCNVLNQTLMECPSPPVNKAQLQKFIRNRRYASGLKGELRLRIGFIMDEVQSVMNLADNFPDVKHELVYFDDPKFIPFDRDRIKLYKGDTLVIEGQNLKRATEQHEVNVTIGTKICNVTSLAMTQLVCTPPTHQPAGTDELGRITEHELPLVVIRVGDSLRFPIGYLRYEMMKHYEFPPEAIGGIAAGGAFLVLLSIVTLIVYRRKSTQAERDYKRIQIQMDTLESNVRNECFAELQTDMTDLTSDLEATGIPFFDYNTYLMNVFFPGVSEDIFQEKNNWTKTMPTNYYNAMLQFEQLLCTGNYSLNSISPIIPSNVDLEHGRAKVFHLVKHDDQHPQNSNERTHKAITEIFLTRLLTTKGTVHKFVDDFFHTILTTNEFFPPAIKWLFDFFDESAREHNITNPEVTFTWKSNCLSLRFWVHMLMHPNYIFDMAANQAVDECLGVISQAFMESFSTTEHRLGKDSPTDKLLFAKDIPHYRELLKQFYSRIQQLPQITDQEMNSTMQQFCLVQDKKLDHMSALKALHHVYANKHEAKINGREVNFTLSNRNECSLIEFDPEFPIENITFRTFHALKAGKTQNFINCTWKQKYLENKILGHVIHQAGNEADHVCDLIEFPQDVYRNLDKNNVFSIDFLPTELFNVDKMSISSILSSKRIKRSKSKRISFMYNRKKSELLVNIPDPDDIYDDFFLINNDEDPLPHQIVIGLQPEEGNFCISIDPNFISEIFNLTGEDDFPDSNCSYNGAIDEWNVTIDIKSNSQKKQIELSLFPFDICPVELKVSLSRHDESEPFVHNCRIPSYFYPVRTDILSTANWIKPICDACPDNGSLIRYSKIIELAPVGDSNTPKVSNVGPTGNPSVEFSIILSVIAGVVVLITASGSHDDFENQNVIENMADIIRKVKEISKENKRKIMIVALALNPTLKTAIEKFVRVLNTNYYCEVVVADPSTVRNDCGRLNLTLLNDSIGHTMETCNKIVFIKPITDLERTLVASSFSEAIFLNCRETIIAGWPRKWSSKNVAIVELSVGNENTFKVLENHYLHTYSLPSYFAHLFGFIHNVSGDVINEKKFEEYWKAENDLTLEDFKLFLEDCQKSSSMLASTASRLISWFSVLMDICVPYLHLILAVLLARPTVFAEEECTRSSGGAIACFECSTDTHLYCQDPFNYTQDPKLLPPVEECMGCCVKIVQNDKSRSKTVTRTCTKKLKINLFMVDHVCMLESNGQGHMCFCEEDQCNGGPSSKLGFSASWLLVVGLGLVSTTLFYRR
uniref:Uncharacterized protein n=1 Tax=Strigamia maritima TaxID=126957 RepID=T1IKW3_STRMM